MKGRILCTDKNEIWLSKGRHIFRSLNNGTSWEKEFSISCSFFTKILFKISLLSRLFRLDIHHFIKIDVSSAVCVFNKEIIWLDLNNKQIVKRDAIHGNRPLSFVLYNKAIIYGEYRSNPERTPVHVWRADIKEKSWSPVMEIIGVRHIHGVYVDTYTNLIWVTTGDEDEEAKVILLNENFVLVRTLIQGSQQTRVVQPIFTELYVYFASDAPNEVNHIYRYNRLTEQIDNLQEVNGPIYFGQTLGSILFFATVAEPSKINSQNTIELWASIDGENWKCVRIFETDSLSLRYFQYGQLIFPNQQLNSQLFYFSEFATNNHLRVHALDIKKLKNKSFN